MAHAQHPVPQGEPPRAFDTVSRLAVGAIGFIAGLAGLLIGLNNPFLRNAASSEGARVDQLFSIMLGVATTFFVIVQGFILLSIVRFGRQPDDDTDGPPIRGNHKLEFFWTAIPAVTVVVLGLMSYQVLAENERAGRNDMVVEVKAFQFAWQFYYPDADVTSSELHLPVDRPVLLRMRSNDVVHSFWVPQFRIKKDVNPDRITEARITPTELGAFPIVCTELCGAGHAIMRSQVIVQSEADFKGWLAASGAAATALAAAPADPTTMAGRQVYTNLGCNACHALADAAAVGQIGPKLDDIGTRAGSIVPGQSAADYIRAAIVKPNEHIADGFPAHIMPQDYELRAQPGELDALVAYLLEMK